MRIPKRNQILASYSPNEMCITLGEKTSLFDDDGFRIDKLKPEEKKDALSTFLHEYYHYIHNFSTVAGFRSFFIFQDFLSLFSGCLNKGLSEGDKTASDEIKQNYKEIMDELLYMEGDCVPESLPDIDELIDFRVESVSNSIENRSYYSTPISRTTTRLGLNCTWKNGSNSKCDFLLGEIAIDEGICYELDRMIAAEIDVANGTSKKIDNSPLLPYLLLRKIGDFLVPHVIDSYSLCACGTMALLSTDPARCLISTLSDFERLAQNGIESEESISKIWKQVSNHFQEVAKIAIEKDLDELVSRHRKRGLLETSLEYIKKLFTELLERRKENPFFDLKPFTTGLCNFSELSNIVNRVVPCAIIQKRPGTNDQIERDRLYTFDPKNTLYAGYRLSEIIRPMQSQLHFTCCHLDENFFAESTSSQDFECPFYSCCDLPFRKSLPSTCKNEPWKHFKENGQTCWYGTAVASTIGHVEIKNVIRRE